MTNNQVAVTNNSMSPSPPRPNMHADLQRTWLWCDDHAKVNQCFMSVNNSHPYHIFYASFINAANKAWVVSTDPNGKLKPIESRMVDCLLQEPIPAEQLIDLLQRYNKYTGGGKGNVKRKGLIKWYEEEPGELTPPTALMEHTNCALLQRWPLSKPESTNSTT